MMTDDEEIWVMLRRNINEDWWNKDYSAPFNKLRNEHKEKCALLLAVVSETEGILYAKINGVGVLKHINGMGWYLYPEHVYGNTDESINDN